jgi:hypothetical protein
MIMSRRKKRMRRRRRYVHGKIMPGYFGVHRRAWMAQERRIRIAMIRWSS